MRLAKLLAAFAAGAFLSGAAIAQTVKIGLINTYSGPMASNGDQIQKAIDLYLKLHEKELPEPPPESESELVTVKSKRLLV